MDAEAGYLHPKRPEPLRPVVLQLINLVTGSVQLAAQDPCVPNQPCVRSRNRAHGDISRAGSDWGSDKLVYAIPVVDISEFVDYPGANLPYCEFGGRTRLLYPSGTLQLVNVVAVGPLVATEDPR